MKVLFLTNVPSPYRVDFFNMLGKHCELTVLFEKSASDERDDFWKRYSFDNFEGIVLNGLKITTDTSLCLSVKKYLKNNNYDIIVCTNFTTPTGMLAVRYMKKHKIPYILESDGGFAKNGEGFKEKIKSYFIKGASFYLSTSDVHDEYYKAYGADSKSIIRYPFSSVKDEKIEKDIISPEYKLKLRNELDITEKKVVISIGQFIHRKGFDILLQSAKSLDDSTGIYIIGGKPTDEYCVLVEKLGLKNVHFVGFKKPDELSKYYKAADLFVLPTREDIWGLVINEAIAYGLPVVTTDRCLAGVEIISNGENGYVVPVEDCESLYDAMFKILADKNKALKISKNNLMKAHLYTLETMVNSHIALFEQIKKEK